MDRISDSGSDDLGSNPDGVTSKHKALMFISATSALYNNFK